MPQKDPSKTEKATPKRVKKERGEGNVHKSQEVSKAVTILAGFTALTYWLSFIAADLSQLFRHFFSTALFTFQATPKDVTDLIFMVAVEIAKMVLPVMLFILLSSFVVLRVQVGKLWTTKVFKPKLAKFNPINGLKRMMFSLETFIRMGKSLLQAVFIGIVPWMVVKAESPKFITLYHADVVTFVVYVLSLGSKVVTYALIPMLIIAAADFFYTKWDYGEKMKMTKDEVKDERRQAEGDPKVKQKQRQKMMEMSMKRMMQDVPKADVVITNPTHIAVALQYNSAEAPAPIVVAKGADKVAEKIKEIARESKVPVRENKPLARALYKMVDVGDMIPEEMYQAVAAILAQVWKTRPPKPQMPPGITPKK